MPLQSPLPPLSDSASSKSLTPQRKHRKLLKDGSGAEVWPEAIEKVFVQGLREYWTSPFATYPQSRGRSRWRNQFLVDYLQKHNIIRSKKQVASHIQVLRNMWKGEPEYQLVAGGEELADVSPPAGSPIKLEDHWSHGLIPMEFDDTDGYSSTSASPDFSPPDFQNQYLPSPDHPATRQLDMTSAANYSADPRNILSSASPYSPSFTNSTPEYSTYGRVSSRTPPTDTAPASEFPKAHHSLNRIRALRLTAYGMSPLLIRMDQLVPLNMPYQPLQLRICLRISTVDDVNCPSTLQGFLANVYLSHMWTSSGKCITKTIVGGTTVAEDVDSLQVSEVNMGTVNALMPESHLSRCRWLDPNVPTNITQEIIIDGVSLLFVIYELDRAAGNSLPSAELTGYLNYPSTSRSGLGSGSASVRPLSHSSSPSAGNFNSSGTNRGFTPLTGGSLGLHMPSNTVTNLSSYSQPHHPGRVPINGALGVNSSAAGVMSTGSLGSYSLPTQPHHAKHTGHSLVHPFPPVRYAVTTTMPS